MVTRPGYDHLYEIAESQTGYFTAGQAPAAGFSKLKNESSTYRTGQGLCDRTASSTRLMEIRSLVQ